MASAGRQLRWIPAASTPPDPRSLGLQRIPAASASSGSPEHRRHRTPSPRPRTRYLASSTGLSSRTPSPHPRSVSPHPSPEHLPQVPPGQPAGRVMWVTCPHPTPAPRVIVGGLGRLLGVTMGLWYAQRGLAAAGPWVFLPTRRAGFCSAGQKSHTRVPSLDDADSHRKPPGQPWYRGREGNTLGGFGAGSGNKPGRGWVGIPIGKFRASGFRSSVRATACTSMHPTMGVGG
jgi:hypothetical protein